MRVVLDTNILFSALISPHGAPDAIYRAWRAARFEVVTSRMQLDEIRRASRYPKLQAILQPAKVGAIGVKISRWVTMHGFALNLSVNLGAFALIVPCGIKEHGVTSIEALTGKKQDVREVALGCAPQLSRGLELQVEAVDDLSSADDPATTLLR